MSGEICFTTAGTVSFPARFDASHRRSPKRIVVIVMVPVTAMPYADASWPVERRRI